MPHVTASESAGEMAVFPRMIEMEFCGLVGAVAMAYPFAVVVHVRGLRMAFPVRTSWSRPGRCSMKRSGPMLRDEAAAYFLAAAALQPHRGRDRDRDREKTSATARTLRAGLIVNPPLDNLPSGAAE
jgi:hypothetical protein